MGTIVLSLPPSSPVPYSGVPSTDLSTSMQVKILSVANTLSRLLAGPLADYISPVVSYTPTGDAWYSRKHRVSRISFIACTTLLLTATFIWTDIRIRSQDALWVLRCVCLIVVCRTCIYLFDYHQRWHWNCLWGYHHCIVGVRFYELRQLHAEAPILDQVFSLLSGVCPTWAATLGSYHMPPSLALPFFLIYTPLSPHTMRKRMVFALECLAGVRLSC
jgi:hypothetical protein